MDTFLSLLGLGGVLGGIVTVILVFLVSVYRVAEKVRDAHGTKMP